LLYANDLADVVLHCKLYLYADDSALFLPINRNLDVGISKELLQSDLNRMNAWSNTWKLNFKGSKSKEVLFKSPLRPHLPFPDLLLNNEPIPKGDSHKHLGVILDSSLNVHQHIVNIIHKCNNKLNPLAAYPSPFGVWFIVVSSGKWGIPSET
jgi:hypothetical protein